MAQATAQNKNTFSQSIGAGIGALSGRANYIILEHVTDSSSHKAGEKEEIIVNYVEIGRDPKCGIRYGEHEKTVSRRHAAITKEENNYVLVQLSKTNPTLLNGRPVNKKWYLQNGDLIQLSAEGPKLNFLVPQNKKSGSIGLTRRLNLFGKQALRPYKTAVRVLAILLLLSVAGGGYALYQLNASNQGLVSVLEDVENKLEESEAKQAALTDSLMNMSSINQEMIDEMGNKITELKRRADENGGSMQNGSTSMSLNANNYTALHNDIYFIVGSNFKLTMPTGEVKSFEDYIWTGTGFLTNEGKFVTARHVVEPWYFPTAENELLFNAIIAVGGNAEADIIAVSPEGVKLEFSSDDFKVNRTDDVEETIELAPGETLPLNHALESVHDWSWVDASRNGELVMDRSLSSQIPQASELFLFGYPLNEGVSVNGLTPLFARTSAALTGLNPEGFIITTTLSFDHGNSGGPVFYTENGQHKVVGIVSGSKGAAMGRFVPVAAMQ